MAWGGWQRRGPLREPVRLLLRAWLPWAAEGNCPHSSPPMHKALHTQSQRHTHVPLRLPPTLPGHTRSHRGGPSPVDTVGCPPFPSHAQAPTSPAEPQHTLEAPRSTGHPNLHFRRT